MTAHPHYLRDLGHEIREKAVAAKASSTSNPTDFERGREAEYYEVVSLMQQQADAFGIPLSELALDGLDADRDLGCRAV